MELAPLVSASRFPRARFAALPRILALASLPWIAASCSGGGGDSSQALADGLTVTPSGGLNAWGLVGGPFSSDSVTYTLANIGAAPLDWTASNSAAWVSLSQTGGNLAAGASALIVVSIDSQADTLPIGRYNDTVAFVNTTNGNGDTTRSVSLAVTSTAGEEMSTASRTSGVAPLSVFFDAVGAASDVIQPTGSTPDYASFHYRWSFGDPGSGAWAVGGKSKNSGTGYVTAHVFETPGTYHVTLQLTQSAGEIRDYYQDVTVTDPETVYAGQTWYVATNGNDSNNGLSPGAPFQSVSRAMGALFASNGPRRVLFRRGDTWTMPAAVSASGRTGPYTIGAFGTGAKPVLRATHAGIGLDLNPSVSDVRIVDVDFLGPHPSASADGVVLGRDCLLLRSTVSGFMTGVGGHATGCIANTVADCALIDNGHYGLYYAPGYNPNAINDPPIHLAVMGNRFDNSIHNSLLRTYVSRSLWQANLFQRAGQSATRLLGIHTPKKAEFVSITDNAFQSLTLWILEIGPENNENGGTGGTPQVVENVIVENNTFSLPGPGQVSRFVLVWGSHVTVRNNCFDHTDAEWGGTILVDRRGIGPVPIGVRIDHNTVFRADEAPTFRFVDATSQDQTLVRNNIVYSPEVASTVATGTTSEQSNLTIDPRFENASAGNFHLQSGSPAIDQGIALDTRSDFDGNDRPLQSGYDIGAFERP